MIYRKYRNNVCIKYNIIFININEFDINIRTLLCPYMGSILNFEFCFQLRRPEPIEILEPARRFSKAPLQLRNYERRVRPSNRFSDNN